MSKLYFRVLNPTRKKLGGKNKKAETESVEHSMEMIWEPLDPSKSVFSFYPFEVNVLKIARL